MKYKRYNILRKRDRKALEKGSVEKGHKPCNVIGLKRSKINGERKGPVMCKVEWEPVKLCSSVKQKFKIDSTGASQTPTKQATEERQHDLFQPEPSFVPFWYLKQREPHILIKYFEKERGYDKLTGLG